MATKKGTCTACSAEIASLKAKLKKAESELKSLKTSRKSKVVQETKALKTKLEKIFSQGYNEAMKDIQKAEAAFEKHMDKAATEFEKNILPKLKKIVSKPAKKKTK